MTQLEAAEDAYQELLRVATTPIAQQTFSMFVTTSLAAVERATGHDSSYSQQARSFLQELDSFGFLRDNSAVYASRLVGVVRSVRIALQKDFLSSVRELVRADVFADLLEMATYLLGEGYKDAAAVMCGTTLESQLHALCGKHGIDIYMVQNGDNRPKAASQLNVELMKSDAYGKIDMQAISSWLAIRNAAAHGEYKKYSQQEVDLMLQGVRGFVARHPA